MINLTKDIDQLLVTFNHVEGSDLPPKEIVARYNALLLRAKYQATGLKAFSWPPKIPILDHDDARPTYADLKGHLQIIRGILRQETEGNVYQSQCG